jgi:hypothetical protein
MRRKLFLATLLVALTALAGCHVMGGIVRPKPRNSLADIGIRRVAVVMLNATKDATVDALEAAEIFSTELQQFQDVEVFPADVAHMAVMENRLAIPEQADLLGRALNVDAVIVGFLTDYQPYDPPRVGILFMVYAARPRGVESSVGHAAKPIVMMEKVYDADQKKVADDVKQFAEDRNSQKTPLAYRQYLVVMSKYLHFVATQSFRDLFDKVQKMPAAEIKRKISGEQAPDTSQKGKKDGP